MIVGSIPRLLYSTTPNTLLPHPHTARVLSPLYNYYYYYHYHYGCDSYQTTTFTTLTALLSSPSYYLSASCLSYFTSLLSSLSCHSYSLSLHTYITATVHRLQSRYPLSPFHNIYLYFGTTSLKMDAMPMRISSSQNREVFIKPASLGSPEIQSIHFEHQPPTTPPAIELESHPHLPQGVEETKVAREANWFVGSIDCGTTSSRFLIFNGDGIPVASHQIEFENLYPESG